MRNKHAAPEAYSQLFNDYQELAQHLVAKDAEIAELRKAMAAQASAVRTLHWAKNEIANGQLQQAHALQQQSKPEALASERDANQKLTDALEQAERERDEARECVGRLYEALVLLEAELIASGNAKATDYGWPFAIEKTRTALAATPEHLRGCATAASR